MPVGTTKTKSPGEDPTLVGFLLENAIRDIGIPPCPAILNQINVEMAKDDPNLRHLDHIICSDVSLASGLIAIANSPFFGLRKRVRSVKEALQLLGLGITARAIAGLILRKLFPPTLALERFWHASAVVSRLAGWLAQNISAVGSLQSEDAYTYGLFRDCGIPILMRRHAHYSDTLKSANEERELDFTEVEQARFSINHAEVGYILAQSWWLPADICNAIRYHHDRPVLEQGSASSLPATALSLIATVQIAEHLFQHHSGLSQNQEWQKLGAACLRQVNLSEADLPLLYEQSMPVIASEE